ncbi:hypothetical protein VP1G_10595 [Cytospora mali]|uniref:Uncharacterized protein n=1 Tax=Cytospora mali TaxID=578113 RepID=A0A194UPH0_CYTMA|nr:hypothetical protein VP1G_10595 [Valsa mali var. pyri (nom. inval.)]
MSKHLRDQPKSEIRDLINESLQSIMLRNILDYAGIVQNNHFAYLVLGDSIIEDVLRENLDVTHTAGV